MNYTIAKVAVIINFYTPGAFDYIFTIFNFIINIAKRCKIKDFFDRQDGKDEIVGEKDVGNNDVVNDDDESIVSVADNEYMIQDDDDDSDFEDFVEKEINVEEDINNL